MDPMTWVYLIMLVVSLVLAIAMRPKPQTPEPQEGQVPQAVDGTKIRKWYGTNWMDDSVQLAWKQDGTEPIRASGGK